MIVRIKDDDGSILEEIEMRPYDAAPYADLIKRFGYIDKEGATYRCDTINVEPYNILEIRLELSD